MLLTPVVGDKARILICPPLAVNGFLPADVSVIELPDALYAALTRTGLVIVTTLCLTIAVETHGWDGAWYRRAFADDGSVLGSVSSVECQIDAIAQSWSVLSGSADRKRARQAVTASEEQLLLEREKLMLLLRPAFTDTSSDTGYISAYPPGIRENGGQYTHGVLWTVLASRPGVRAL